MKLISTLNKEKKILEEKIVKIKIQKDSVEKNRNNQ